MASHSSIRLRGIEPGRRLVEQQQAGCADQAGARGRAGGASRPSRSARAGRRRRSGRSCSSTAVALTRPPGRRLPEQPGDHLEVLAAGHGLLDRRVLAGQPDQPDAPGPGGAGRRCRRPRACRRRGGPGWRRFGRRWSCRRRWGRARPRPGRPRRPGRGRRGRGPCRSAWSGRALRRWGPWGSSCPGVEESVRVVGAGGRARRSSRVSRGTSRPGQIGSDQVRSGCRDPSSTAAGAAPSLVPAAPLVEAFELAVAMSLTSVGPSRARLRAARARTRPRARTAGAVP